MNLTLKEVIDNRFTNSRATLVAKGKEYQSANNRYYQFVEAGKLMNVSPAIALIGMQIKHFTPVIDMALSTVTKHKSLDSRDTLLNKLEEKSGDLFNYYILLAGLNQEEQNLTLLLEEIQDSFKDNSITDLKSVLYHPITELVSAFKNQHNHMILLIKDKTFDWEMFSKLLIYNLILEYQIRVYIAKVDCKPEEKDLKDREVPNER